jgi:LPS sulfotransferase NodH
MCDLPMEAFAEDNRQFDRFFGRNGIVPTHVVYEQLIADPQAAARAIGQAIAVPDLTVVPDRIGVRRQAGPINARWRELYLAGR